MLGVTLSSVVSRDSGILGDTSSYLRNQVLQQSGRIAYTLSGASGDCGVCAVGAFVTSPDLLADWEASLYPTLQDTRIIHRYFDSVYVGNAGQHIGMCYGQDCCGETTPYFPYGRDEDGLMSSTISRICSPTSFRAYLPIEVLHLPEAPRRDADPWTQLFAAPRFNDILAVICASIGREFSPYQICTYSDLGARLCEVATSDDKSFQLVFRKAFDTLLLTRLQAVRVATDHSIGADARIAKDLRQAKHVLERALMIDLSEMMGALLSGTKTKAKARSAIRERLLLFGRLLGAWPHLVAAAKGDHVQDLKRTHTLSGA